MPAEQLTKDRQLTKTTQWEKALHLLYNSFLESSHNSLSKFASKDVLQAQYSCRKLLTLLNFLDPNHTLNLHPPFEKALKRLSKVQSVNLFIDTCKSSRKQAKEDDDTKTSDLLKAVIDHQKDKRKTYRKRLADELSKILDEDLDTKWNTFLSEQLEALIAKRDINVFIRELEVAYEQQKKACKALFRDQEADSEAVMSALEKLRVAAEQLQYTASAANFALNQKFHGYEEIFKQIVEPLRQISDKRLRLEALTAIGREELDIGKKAWSAFLSQLEAEFLDALYHNPLFSRRT